MTPERELLVVYANGFPTDVMNIYAVGRPIPSGHEQQIREKFLDSVTRNLPKEARRFPIISIGSDGNGKEVWSYASRHKVGGYYPLAPEGGTPERRDFVYFSRDFPKGFEVQEKAVFLEELVSGSLNELRKLHGGQEVQTGHLVNTAGNKYKPYNIMLRLLELKGYHIQAITLMA